MKLTREVLPFRLNPALMAPKTFIDSNLLLYTVDHLHPEKLMKAKKLLEASFDTPSFVISTQVLAECANVLQRKWKIPLPQVTQFLAQWDHLEIVLLVPQDIEKAANIADRYDVAFYDALIIQSAAKAHCDLLLSEDFQHGQTYQGVKVENPLL